MQPQGSAETQSAPPPPAGGGGGSGRAGLATALAAVAIAIALVAVGVSFVLPGPAGAKGDQGVQGVHGTPGTNGTNGTQGPPYEVFYAVISASGAVVRGAGVNSSTTVLHATGEYNVLFDQNVSACSFEASIGLTGSSGTAPPGFVTVVGLAISSYGVWVSTYNVTGVLTSQPFHLTVLCNAGLWAVIASSGSVVRGSGVNSSTTAIASAGEYTVLFDQDVAACTFEATIGLTGSSGTAPAGFISVVGMGASSYGVWVSTYNVTGVPTSQSFHLAVFC